MEKPLEVTESTEYESCMDVKDDSCMPVSLANFLDIEDNTADDEEAWKKHWKGMPEFLQEENAPYKKIIVSFRNEKDYKDFADCISDKLTEKTKSIWFPKLDKDQNTLKRWVENE